jgi:hypothetical protein
MLLVGYGERKTAGSLLTPDGFLVSATSARSVTSSLPLRKSPTI